MIENKKNLSDNDSLMYRPFSVDKSSNITIKRDHYSTSLDPRGYIPVYEYIINGTPIMWDRETGYVHFTGIWKALGNSKSDIVKMVDSNPELGTKKIRGGFLRIQGTWIPYDYAHLLCKRTAWNIRNELIPIFGPKFVTDALSPNHEDFGCLLLDPKTNYKTQLNQQKNIHQKRMIKHTNQQKSYTKQIVKSNLKKSKQKINNKIKKKQQKPKSIKKKITTSSMSVTRLLNQDLSEEDDYMSLSDESSLSSIQSPIPITSPTLRVIQTYPNNWSTYQLPPIYNNNLPSPTSSTSSIPIITESSSSPSSYSFASSNILPSIWESTNNSTVSHASQDIIDTISATILLQRLSQDDGARPFKPFEASYIPSKVIVGHQEFTICWD